MTSKKISFQRIENLKYAIYWKKAQDFYRGMLVAYANGNWHSVGLESVHCAISATDAIVVYKSGMRSISKDHRAAAAFLTEQIGKDKVGKYAGALLKILDMKNHIEYEDRIFTEKEAEEYSKENRKIFQLGKETTTIKSFIKRFILSQFCRKKVA